MQLKSIFYNLNAKCFNIHGSFMRDGLLEIINYLLNEGAAPLTKDKKGDTLLVLAQRHDRNYKNKVGKPDTMRFKETCELLRHTENKLYGKKEEKLTRGTYSKEPKSSVWHPPRSTHPVLGSQPKIQNLKGNSDDLQSGYKLNRRPSTGQK